MKKQIAIALGAVVLSGSAHATKARLEALGQDAKGSQFISDNRNVFLNAAHVNLHKDLVTFEWGNTTNTTDDAATPRSEGGAFLTSDNMVYGLYMGNESDTSNGLRAAAGLTGAAQENNNIDFFVGGDAGMQWGAALTYSNTAKGDGDVEQSAMRMNLGAISGDLEYFANIGLGNTATNGTQEFEGASSVDAGVTYNMGEMSYYARYSTLGADVTLADGADAIAYSANTMRLGAAKTYKVNDRGTLWMSAEYVQMTSEGLSTGVGYVDGAEANATYLPVGIALEVMAKDWLTLRGSVTQNVLISEVSDADNTSPNADTTVVRAGASLIFGDLSLDGVIGNVDPATDGVAAEGTNTGALQTDTLMSRVSMTYRF